MMSWLHYLLEANLYLAIAYGCYWVLFRKQTFYSANRAYLLLSTVICFVMPIIQLNIQQPAQPAAAVQQITIIEQNTATTTTAQVNNTPVTLNKAITSVYLTAAALMLVMFTIKLYSLLKLVLANQRAKQEGYTLVYIKHPPTPFSFFGFLFVSNKENLQESVLRHELVHIRQKHSCDIVFTEVLKIVSWFNPVVYLLQNSLKALHEYEADRLASATSGQRDGYVDFLIAQAYQSSNVPFANHFSNQQLLKSRIMKLYQKRSGKLARLNYLVAVPLCAGLLCASTLAFSKDYGWIKLSLKKKNISTLPLKASTDTSDKNKRLKVTSGGMTGITDKLEVKSKPGETLIYTAKTLTTKDKELLLKKYGIRVETTSALATTTSISLPPPPPTTPRKFKSPPRVLEDVKTIPPPPPPAKNPKSPPRVMEEVKEVPPPPPPAKPVKNNAAKINHPGSLSSAINDTKGKLISTLHIPKHFVGNVFVGSSPEMQFDSFTDDYLKRPQKVYIQIDNPKMENIEPNKPIVFGDNYVYLINGKIYTVEELERRSAAISTKNKTGRLLHAEKVVYHKPNNPEDIAKYGSIAKDGIEEFVSIISSNL